MVATIRRKVLKNPAYVVDSVTHQIVATIDENGKRDPETLTVTNPGKKLAVPKSMRLKGAKPFALGGELTANADPNDPDIQNKIASGAVYFNPQTNSIDTRPVATPRITAPAFNNGAGLINGQGSASGGTPTQNAIYGAQVSQLGARQNTIVAQMQQLVASGNADSATAAYIAELKRADAANQAYLQQQQASNQSATADQQKLINAQNDVAGNTAAGQAQYLRESQGYVDNLAGLPHRVEVNTPGGAPLPAGSPPGVVAKIQTPADVVTQQNQQNAVTRNASDQAAQIANQEAQLASTASYRNVQTANLGVTEAGRAVTGSQLQEDQASLDQSRAQLAPPGQVYDAYSGTFMTPAEQNIAQAQRATVYDPVNQEFVTRADLLARTDNSGNVLNQKTQTWVDPTNGNQYVNGTWTDPKTGGVYDAQANVWNYPDGSKYVVTDPGGRNPDGSHRQPQGYTMDAEGFQFNANDGTWSRRAPDGYGGYNLQYKVPDANGNLQLVESGSAGGGISINADGTTSQAAPGGAGGTAFHNSSYGSATIDPATALATVKSVLPAFPAQQQSNAERISIAESGGDPTRISDPNKDGSRDYGLWQINSGNFAKLTQALGTPVNAQTILAPDLNAKAANVILGWGKGSWQANWTTAKGLGIP